MANKKVLDEIIEDDVLEETPEEIVINDSEVEELPTEETLDEVLNEEVEEVEEKDIEELVKGRGFNCYNEAVEYSSSEAFKRLHPLDQEEFNTWLKNIK